MTQQQSDSISHPSMASSFFSLTGGSILYCLSALSIVYGIANILGPLLAKSEIICDALPCLTALNIYEIALLGVLVFIVVREKVTDDAISLVILVALFLVGTGLALTTVSNDSSNMALLIGTTCFLLGVGKLYILRRYIGLALHWWSFAGLALILAWNFGAGPLLNNFIKPLPDDRSIWLISWLFLLTGGSLVFLDSQASDNKSKHDTAPFIQGPGTPLLFAFILLVAGAAHQYVLGYVFDVKACFGDYLPLISIASLVALRLSLTIWPQVTLLDIGLASLPLAGCCFAILTRSVPAAPSFGIEAIWSPPVLLALVGAAVFLVWLRTQANQLLSVCSAYFLGIILTWGFSPNNPFTLNWYITGSIVVIIFMVTGLLKRNVALCFFSIIVATAGLATTASFQQLVNTWHLTYSVAIIGIAGIGTLTIALIFGRLMPDIIMILAAIGVMTFTFDALQSEPSIRDFVVISGVSTICAAIWMRLRKWPLLVILLIPIGKRLWILFSLLTAWRYVALSFVLLFAGAWLSTRKGRKQLQSDASIDSKQSHSNPQSD